MTFASLRLDGNHAVVVDARGIGSDAFRLVDGSCDCAGFKVHFPRVQRTHHGVAGDDPVAERPALMRTLVVDGKKAITEVEDRDLLIADERRPPLARRNAVARGDSDPIHDNTLSIGRRGMNCVGLTGDPPSSHASFYAALDFCSRSSSERF